MKHCVAGISVSSRDAIIVVLNGDEEPYDLVADATIKLQSGDRFDAYPVFRGRISDFLSNHKVDLCILKASTVSLRGTRLAHLEAAELRGIVVISVAMADISVKSMSKSHLSRSFGQRNVDEYVGDDTFWNSSVNGKIRKGSREAALLALSSLKE